MSERDAHDSRELLESCDLPTPRHIGVLASNPYYHHGLKAQHVSIDRDTIAVTSRCFGGTYPVEEANDRLRAAIQDTITDLDTAIDELTMHRDRLHAELAVGDLYPQVNYD
jgi:hypothetical protein